MGGIHLLPYSVPFSVTSIPYSVPFPKFSVPFLFSRKYRTNIEIRTDENEIFSVRFQLSSGSVIVWPVAGLCHGRPGNPKPRQDTWRKRTSPSRRVIYIFTIIRKVTRWISTLKRAPTDLAQL
jgi:hypothetical protein